MNRRDNMLKQGEMIVYKCRGMFQVKEVGKLNFSYIDRKKITIHFIRWKMTRKPFMYLQMLRTHFESR